MSQVLKWHMLGLQSLFYSCLGLVLFFIKDSDVFNFEEVGAGTNEEAFPELIYV